MYNRIFPVNRKVFDLMEKRFVYADNAATTRVSKMHLKLHYHTTQNNTAMLQAYTL